MEFALNLPFRRLIKWKDYKGPETVIEMAKRVEKLGFYGFTAGDHIVMPNYWLKEATEVWFDPFSFLGWVAGATNLRLITNIVVVPYRSPLHTAKAIATLDYMSKGRVIFGASVGYLEGEFKTLHVPFEERAPRTDEYIKMMKVLWTQEEPKFEGKYYSCSDLRMWPKPVQKPHPPIWIGGKVKASIRRAVELGDGWIPFQVNYEGLKESSRYLNELWEKRGSKKENFQIAWPLDRVTIEDKRNTEPTRRMFQGSPEQVIEDMDKHIAEGVTFFWASFQGREYDEFWYQVERFAHEIMPRFKARVPKAPY